jgi:C-methyltransferase C-terminal domain
LLELLIRLKREAKQVVGYGAPGKGNTLRNHCWIDTDFLDYTVDRIRVQARPLHPGTHIRSCCRSGSPRRRGDSPGSWPIRRNGARLQIVPVPTPMVLEPTESPVDGGLGGALTRCSVINRVQSGAIR